MSSGSSSSHQNQSASSISKSEKQKFKGININNIYKGTSSSPPKPNTTRHHGLQVLGKVQSRRIPPPPAIPSLKANNSNDSSSTPSSNLLIITSSTTSTVSGSLANILSHPEHHNTGWKEDKKQALKSLPPQQVETSSTNPLQLLETGPTHPNALWSDITSGGKRNFLDKSFQEDFPVLKPASHEVADESSSATNAKKGQRSQVEFKEPMSGTGPSLRPQNLDRWRDGGGGKGLNVDSAEETSDDCYEPPSSDLRPSSISMETEADPSMKMPQRPHPHPFPPQFPPHRLPPPHIVMVPFNYNTRMNYCPPPIMKPPPSSSSSSNLSHPFIDSGHFPHPPPPHLISSHIPPHFPRPEMRPGFSAPSITGPGLMEGGKETGESDKGGSRGWVDLQRRVDYSDKINFSNEEDDQPVVPSSSEGGTRGGGDNEGDLYTQEDKYMRKPMRQLSEGNQIGGRKVPPQSETSWADEDPMREGGDQLRGFSKQIFFNKTSSIDQKPQQEIGNRFPTNQMPSMIVKQPSFPISIRDNIADPMFKGNNIQERPKLTQMQDFRGHRVPLNQTRPMLPYRPSTPPQSMVMMINENNRYGNNTNNPNQANPNNMINNNLAHLGLHNYNNKINLNNVTNSANISRGDVNMIIERGRIKREEEEKRAYQAKQQQETNSDYDVGGVKKSQEVKNINSGIKKLSLESKSSPMPNRSPLLSSSGSHHNLDHPHSQQPHHHLPLHHQQSHPPFSYRPPSPPFQSFSTSSSSSPPANPNVTDSKNRSFIPSYPPPPLMFPTSVPATTSSYSSNNNQPIQSTLSSTSTSHLHHPLPLNSSSLSSSSSVSLDINPPIRMPPPPTWANQSYSGPAPSSNKPQFIHQNKQQSLDSEGQSLFKRPPLLPTPPSPPHRFPQPLHHQNFALNHNYDSRRKDQQEDSGRFLTSRHQQNSSQHHQQQQQSKHLFEDKQTEKIKILNRTKIETETTNKNIVTKDNKIEITEKDGDGRSFNHPYHLKYIPSSNKNNEQKIKQQDKDLNAEQQQQNKPENQQPPLQHQQQQPPQQPPQQQQQQQKQPQVKSEIYKASSFSREKQNKQHQNYNEPQLKQQQEQQHSLPFKQNSLDSNRKSSSKESVRSDKKYDEKQQKTKPQKKNYEKSDLGNSSSRSSSSAAGTAGGPPHKQKDSTFSVYYNEDESYYDDYRYYDGYYKKGDYNKRGRGRGRRGGRGMNDNGKTTVITSAENNTITTNNNENSFSVKNIIPTTLGNTNNDVPPAAGGDLKTSGGKEEKPKEKKEHKFISREFVRGGGGRGGRSGRGRMGGGYRSNINKEETKSGVNKKTLNDNEEWDDDDDDEDDMDNKHGGGGRRRPKPENDDNNKMSPRRPGVRRYSNKKTKSQRKPLDSSSLATSHSNPNSTFSNRDQITSHSSSEKTQVFTSKKPSHRLTEIQNKDKNKDKSVDLESNFLKTSEQQESHIGKPSDNMRSPYPSFSSSQASATSSSSNSNAAHRPHRNYHYYHVSNYDRRIRSAKMTAAANKAYNNNNFNINNNNNDIACSNTNNNNNSFDIKNELNKNHFLKENKLQESPKSTPTHAKKQMNSDNNNNEEWETASEGSEVLGSSERSRVRELKRIRMPNGPKMLNAIVCNNNEKNNNYNKTINNNNNNNIINSNSNININNNNNINTTNINNSTFSSLRQPTNL